MQRKLETAIRYAKDRQKIAKSAGDDTLRRQEQKRLNDLTRKYKDFSEKAGLSVKKDRMSVSGYHRVKPLDNGGGSGIIGVGSDKMLKVNTGGKRNEIPLTTNEIAEVKRYAVSLGMPEDRIYYVDYDCTGYGASFDLLRIGTDVFPSSQHQKSANSNISMHGAIAHEIIGHRMAALAGKTHPDELLEEVQASIRAAKFTPDLNDSERITLYRDAITRLKNNNIKLKDVKNDLYIFEE